MAFAIEQKIRELVAEAGYAVYDLEFPISATHAGGTLRIYISHLDGSPHNVGFDQVTTCARAINASLELEELLPEHTTIEVSSPGVNRPLRTDAHFSGAVGERVRLVYREEKKNVVVRGVLQQVNDHELTLQPELDSKAARKGRAGKAQQPAVAVQVIPRSAVVEARVDFEF